MFRLKLESVKKSPIVKFFEFKVYFNLNTVQIQKSFSSLIYFCFIGFNIVSSSDNEIFLFDLSRIDVTFFDFFVLDNALIIIKIFGLN